MCIFEYFPALLLWKTVKQTSQVVKLKSVFEVCFLWNLRSNYENYFRILGGFCMSLRLCDEDIALSTKAVRKWGSNTWTVLWLKKQIRSHSCAATYFLSFCTYLLWERSLNNSVLRPEPETDPWWVEVLHWKDERCFQNRYKDEEKYETHTKITKSCTKKSY